MKNVCINTSLQAMLLLMLCKSCVVPHDSPSPDMMWYNGFGTDLEEHVHEGWQTSDLGFIGIGETQEREGDATNILVVKVDAHGTQQWMREIGTRDKWDVGFCVKETAGGYIIGAGIYDPDTRQQERGLIKLDDHGKILWQKTYPRAGESGVRGIDISEDGDILATGYTRANRGGFLFIVEDGDGFVMKTDPDGNMVWDKAISSPQGTKVRIEMDGGLAIASTKWVNTHKRDNQDVVLIRTDKEGNELSVWNYGAENNDQCFDFDLTHDGGYIFAGHTLSYGSVNWDYLLIKVDSSGNQEWVRTFGQPRGYDPKWIHDESYGVRATQDGGYIVAGGSGDEFPYSESGHPSGPSDEWKAYLVKTDKDGNTLWDAVYPPNSVGNNAAEFIALTSDGGYVVFTDTDSESPPPPNNFGFLRISPDTISQNQ